MLVLCSRLSSLRKPDPPRMHSLACKEFLMCRGTSKGPAGGQRAPSACWIHYSHKLIGGLSVFGLAEQYLLPATLTEAMCQFIMGPPHTSTLQCPRCDAFHERGFAGGVICLPALLSKFLRVEICKCHR